MSRRVPSRRRGAALVRRFRSYAYGFLSASAASAQVLAEEGGRPAMPAFMRVFEASAKDALDGLAPTDRPRALAGMDAGVAGWLRDTADRAPALVQAADRFSRESYMTVEAAAERLLHEIPAAYGTASRSLSEGFHSAADMIAELMRGTEFSPLAERMMTSLYDFAAYSDNPVERAVGIGGTLVVAATISIIGQASLRAAAKGVREVIAGDVGFVKREWTAMRERLRGSSPTPAPAAPDGSDAPTQPPAASSERAREALARAVAEVTGLPETEIEKLKGVIGAQADLIGFEAHEASELAQEVRALREENRDLRRENAETLHVVRGLSIRLERLEASRKESLRMQEEIVADLGNGGAPTTIH